MYKTFLETIIKADCFIAEVRRENDAAGKAVSLAIAEAEARFWKELIDGLNRDREQGRVLILKSESGASGQDTG